MIRNFTFILISLTFIIGFTACNSTSGLFTKKTQREKYEDRMKEISPKNDPAVSKWISAGKYSLAHPYHVAAGYTESGKFSSGDSTATSFLIDIKRGQKLTVSFSNTSAAGKAYLDLWDVTSSNPELISAADTATNFIEYIANSDVSLIARFQGEINYSGSYIFRTKVGPSLSYPIAANIKAPIGSFWADARDGGARKHEGVDIMAPKHSPAVAAANGTVTSVSENELGGKTVSMNPDHTNISLYYAHLDSQNVSEGQRVKTGDVLGITGNTGNARNTVSHLHFGIYTNSGAINPLLFIKPVVQKKETEYIFPMNISFSVLKPVKIYAASDKFSAASDVNPNNVITIRGISDEFYRVAMANGTAGFMLKNSVKLK